MTQPVKILLVDDIEQNVVALEALLAGSGIEALRALSGAQALELLLKHDVALALIDVQMPGMDGFELAELMRGSARTCHVPIIFLTATDRNPGRTFRGYEAGAVDFLYKPFDAHVLRSKVEIFVELHARKLQLDEQLETVRQLVRTNEMFVAVLGHDLRNPLASIITNAEILSRLSDDARIAATSKRIRDSGGRMARMIEQLLDVAHMRSGHLGLVPVAADLHAVCADIVAEFESGAPHGQGPGQADDLGPSPRAPRIELRTLGDTAGWWDVDRISQVFSNLIGNALQHGHPDDPVRIRIDGTQGNRVQVAVQNTGTIPPDLVGDVFKPFRSGRPEGCERLAGSGLGLGLYIVSELVRLHQGRVDVVSSTLDGTTFNVILPRGRRDGVATLRGNPA